MCNCTYVCSNIRVRARALTSLSSAASSTQNLELIAVVKELVLPHHDENQPMETNGTYCMYVCMYALLYVHMCVGVYMCVFCEHNIILCIILHFCLHVLYE